MGAEPKGFDAETLPHASRIPKTAKVLLPRVHVSWTDAQGAHDLRVDKSAIIGSSPSVPLRIEDPLVSRLHAELTIQPTGVWLRDLASKNGTFIEGVRVIEALVPPGGRVRVGATILQLVESWDASPPELWPTEQFGPLVGRSQPMRELFARLSRVASTTTPVLLLGETGTGKELVARTIHARSPSSAGAFVPLDCAALSLSLEGASDPRHHPSLQSGVISALEGARGGTIFLDEIGDLPLAVQPSLLRILEQPGNVRFVAATQRDLPRLVSEGAFREDLYFRIAVLPITVPPLRDRLEDLPLLALAFLPPEEHAAVTPALLESLRARPWRGNIRELRNFVERALAFGTDEALDLLPPSEGPSASRTALPRVTYDEPFKVVRDRWVVHLEREYMRGVLARTGGNVSAAAEAAGLDRAYVYRLIRKHGL
ncbi:MAG: Response regulator of zinc sigma-54-dependent two-component system [Labilithrix sp.]|nr:Response regulator of zinc sigma-54-dependent two-component system [Labilithrix sp.]